MTPAQKVIERFQAVFGESNTADADVFIEEYLKAISGYDARALDAASLILIRTAKFWPRPAELIEIVESILRERERIKPPEEDRGEWSKDRIAAACRMIQSPLGERAVAEGWIGYLWDYCRAHQRMPREHEIPTLIGQQRELENMMAGLENSREPMQRQLYKLGMSIEGRAKQLAEIVEGTRDKFTPIETGWPA